MVSTTVADRVRVDDVHLVARHDHRALLTPGERRDLAVVLHALQRVVELVDLVERRDLGLVGEQHVDVVLDQLEELVRGGGRRRSASDSVNATRLPASCAARAARRNASLASGSSQR